MKNPSGTKQLRASRDGRYACLNLYPEMRKPSVRRDGRSACVRLDINAPFVLDWQHKLFDANRSFSIDLMTCKPDRLEAQGNVIGRAVIEFCDGAPPVKNFISLGGPHADTPSVPLCGVCISFHIMINT